MLDGVKTPKSRAIDRINAFWHSKIYIPAEV